MAGWMRVLDFEQTAWEQVLAGIHKACQSVGPSLDAVDPPEEDEDVTELLFEVELAKVAHNKAGVILN